MYIFFLVCLLAGGTLMLGQFLLSLLGVGDHHDADAGHDVHDPGGHDHGTPQSSWFVGALTFRSAVAALTFFGLVGLAASDYGKMEPLPSLGVALAAGVAALFLVGYLMRGLHRLRAEGTARIERAVGRPGTVYVPIPGRKAGAGKVTLNLQNRTVEYQAVTPHEALPTGTRVTVTAVLGRDTVEVVPATDNGSTTHA